MNTPLISLGAIQYLASLPAIEFTPEQADEAQARAKQIIDNLSGGSDILTVVDALALAMILTGMLIVTKASGT